MGGEDPYDFWARTLMRVIWGENEYAEEYRAGNLSTVFAEICMPGATVALVLPRKQDQMQKSH